MEEIEKNDFNLSIPHYVSTAKPEGKNDLQVVNAGLLGLERNIISATTRHNEFLEQLGLPLLPLSNN